MSGCPHLILSFRIMIFGIISAFSSGCIISGSTSIPSLERIVFNGDSVITPGSSSWQNVISGDRDLVLSKRMNSILFEVNPDKDFEYQFFLKGSDRVWSEWRQANHKEYTNLPAGHYHLLVRARGSDNRVEEATLISLRILPVWYTSSPFISGVAVLILLIVWALYDQLNLRFARKQYMLEQIINARTEELVIEKEKTEALLANLLPKNTAEELMAKGKATKIKYNFVTVLFSDIQGFTKIAEEMNPEILIDELDKFFFTFDSVVEKYGIEKIKTIGDAYMCAGGIPEKNRTNPVEVILAALEMKAYMNKLKESSELEGMKFWDIRIGIHTGTVVAGVVGQKKLSYDIWGDTVNTASRMESSGEAGKINISGTTFEFVKDFFSCEYRGKMPVKYKGELEMYFVNGIVPELSDDKGGPNRSFIVKMQLLKLEDIEELVAKMFESGAPQNLYFHNLNMFKNICDQVDLLSRAENLSDDEFINLKLAAIFLLTGFISDYFKPMEGALRMIEELLPRHGFNQDNVDITRRIIKNSFNDQHDTIHDKILHDARYDYLGRVDYIKLTEKLRNEKAEYGTVYDDNTWTEMQSRFLKDHLFLTGTGQILRNVPVESQVAALHPKE
jgi:adenylate cyclase